MSCDQFEKFELGDLGEKEFREHLKECSACQEHTERDERLMSAVKSLKMPVKAPGLWTRIERTLEEEQRGEEDIRVRRIRWRPIPLIPIAAMVLIAVCIVLYMWLKPGVGESKLLAQGAEVILSVNVFDLSSLNFNFPSAWTSSPRQVKSKKVRTKQKDIFFRIGFSFESE